MSRVQVVKVGGAALADAGWVERFARAAVGGVRRIVVHGGGPEVSRVSEQHGIQVLWNNGRRVTSEEALDVAGMVLTGRINKRIVRVLCATGVDAIGLSGEDAGLIQATVAQDGALGRVGEVVAVRTDLLRSLLQLGLVPVISPISSDGVGGALNVNADEVAAAVARALNAHELLFLTDVPAVRDVAGDRAELSAAEAQELIAGGTATGGMAVKLQAAIAALRSGVERVRVGSLDMMNHEEAGTTIRHEQVAACP